MDTKTQNIFYWFWYS